MMVLEAPAKAAGEDRFCLVRQCDAGEGDGKLFDGGWKSNLAVLVTMVSTVVGAAASTASAAVAVLGPGGWW